MSLSGLERLRPGESPQWRRLSSMGGSVRASAILPYAYNQEERSDGGGQRVRLPTPIGPLPLKQRFLRWWHGPATNRVGMR
jgi:hypothetical protein